jgi:hypothetical protein
MSGRVSSTSAATVTAASSPMASTSVSVTATATASVSATPSAAQILLALSLSPSAVSSPQTAANALSLLGICNTSSLAILENFYVDRVAVAWKMCTVPSVAMLFAGSAPPNSVVCGRRLGRVQGLTLIQHEGILSTQDNMTSSGKALYLPGDVCTLSCAVDTFHWGPTALICDFNGKWLPAVVNSRMSSGSVPEELVEPACDARVSTPMCLTALPLAPRIMELAKCETKALISYETVELPAWARYPFQFSDRSLSFLDVAWSSHAVALDQLLQLQRFVRFPAGSYVVNLRAEYVVANERKIAHSVLIPAVVETSRMRSLGVVYDDFDTAVIVSTKQRLYSEISLSTQEIAFAISVFAQQQYGDRQRRSESVPFPLSLAPDGTLSIPESVTCHRTTMVAMLQKHLPRLSSSQAIIQENIVLSDSLPGLDTGAQARMLFPAFVQQAEVLSISCEISESLKSNLQFASASFFRLTRDAMMSKSMTANGLILRSTQFLSGLDIVVKGRFDRNSFSGPTIAKGNIMCNVSASPSAAPSVFVPSYRSQTLSIEVVWIGSAWPLFSDIIIETDTRIGSIWTPPSQWLQVSSAFSSSKIGSKRRRGMEEILAEPGSNRNATERISLWKLQESDIMSVISYVSRSPSADTPFSFALSRGEMNVTIVADSGFWLATYHDALRTIRGPFTRNTDVSLAGKQCHVTWAAANGRAIRITIPSLATWCTGKQKAACDSMVFTISTDGISDVVLASLASTSDLESLGFAPSVQSINGGIRPLAAAISCPPFCPGGFTYALEPFVAGSDWVSRNNISSARISPSLLLAPNLLKGAELGWSIGFSFSDGCEHLGYEPFLTGPDKFSGPCMNESSGAFCAYMQDGVCAPCPLGAMCPGHPYIFPKKGYWSAAFPTDPLVEKCPPPSAVRCPGFNILMFSLTCGVGYTGRRCSACSKRFYNAINDSTGEAICLPCNLERKIQYLPTLYFFICLFGLGCVITLASWTIARRYGGSIVGSMKRSIKFIMFVFLCAQYLVQVGKATKTAAGIAPIFRLILKWLEALQFSGLTLPPECLNSPPFSNELAQMGLMLGALGFLFLVTMVWAGVLALGRQAGWKLDISFRIQTKAIGMSSRRRLIFNAALASIFKARVFRKLASLTIAAMFALVCNTCLGILKCDVAKPVRVQMYLGLVHDGSAIRRANIDCGAAECLSHPPVPTAVLQQLISVSVVSKYPGFVCGEAEHRVARIMAIVTLVFVTVIYPLVTSTFLYIRLRQIVKRLKETGKGEHILLHPCLRRKGSGCINQSTVRQGSSVVGQPTYRPGAASKKQDAALFTRNPSADNEAKYGVVNSDPCINEADADPYFEPLAETVLLPSGFYFMQLHQVLAFSLSISLTYLDQLQHAWWRLCLNSLTILGLLALLFITKPYRPSEKFSAHVQISLLALTYFVALTGFTGTLSSPNIRPSSMLANATSNATAAVTQLEVQSSSPGMERATTILSYVTLLLMLVVIIFLLFSFFDALKVGAIFEKNVGSSVSKARTVIYSLASAVRHNQEKKKHQTIEPSGLRLFTRYSTANPREKTSIQMAGEVPDAFSTNARQQVVAKDKTSGGSFAPVQSRPTSIISNRNLRKTTSGLSPSASRAFSRRNNGDSQRSLPSATLAPTINPFWRASAPRTSIAPPSVPRQH